jgi:hypothetical protein
MLSHYPQRRAPSRTNSKIVEDDVAVVTCFGVLKRMCSVRPHVQTVHNADAWWPSLRLPQTFGWLQRSACYINHVFNSPDSRMGKIIFIFLGLTIMVSVISFCAATMPVYRGEDSTPPLGFFVVDAICLIIFSVDFILRLLTCMAVPWSDESGAAECRPLTCCSLLWFRLFRKLFHFLLSPLNIIDAVAIFPSFAIFSSYANTSGESRRLLILRAVRLARVIRYERLHEYASLHHRPTNPSITLRTLRYNSLL